MSATFVHSNVNLVAVIARWGTSLELAIVSADHRFELRNFIGKQNESDCEMPVENGDGIIG